MVEPIVVVRNLSFTYNGATAPALMEINLNIRPGEFLTVTGPSGCGKSTLALCLAGFIPHAYPGSMTGTVWIKGRDTKDYPAGGLSGIVGLVQQDPEAQLCTLTVKDEVAFGPENLCLKPAQIQRHVYSALEKVGALDLIERQVHTLSGGEKQRVAIAAVLAMTPSLLILDEPTANLDPAGTKAVLCTLERLRADQEVAIIVIEHRLRQLASISDDLLFMDQGKIISRGGRDQFRRTYVPARGRKEKKTQLPSPAQKGSPILAVKKLRAGYLGPDILSDVSFSAYPGETIALMGNNGSGKTTLLLALLGLIKPRSGRIYVNGKEVTKIKTAQRAQQMGLIFQNPNHQLFENTVLKEAQLPSLFLSEDRPDQVESNVLQLLAKFELKQYQAQNPFCLSLGEKKRLTLVSVLAYLPPILILDEPIVGQDSRRLGFLLTALEEHRARGGLALLACHEPDVVAACCNRILFLDEGRIAIDAPLHEAWDQLARLGRDEYLPERR